MNEKSQLTLLLQGTRKKPRAPEHPVKCNKYIKEQ